MGIGRTSIREWPWEAWCCCCDRERYRVIDSWCSEAFGEHGLAWQTVDEGWWFRELDDALLFRMTWG